MAGQGRSIGICERLLVAAQRSFEISSPLAGTLICASEWNKRRNGDDLNSTMLPYRHGERRLNLNRGFIHVRYQAMTLVAAFCVVLIVLTTLLHYEALRALTAGLSVLRMRPRSKLIFVIFGAFFAHITEIFLYAVAYYVLIHFYGAGPLGHVHLSTLNLCLYFSAETYTSLGYGDVVPSGELRLMAGLEALNGLLLIGWSASYTYIAMEQFWRDGNK